MIAVWILIIAGSINRPAVVVTSYRSEVACIEAARTLEASTVSRAFCLKGEAKP